MTQRTDALKLSDIRWIEDDLATALEEAGLTVQTIAGMSAEALLAAYPFVGTINAWLLVSEAGYLMQQVDEGLWDPGAMDELEATLHELTILEEQERRTRIRPLMVWPPPQGIDPEPQGRSARVRRIQEQHRIADESERMRAWLTEQLKQEAIAEQKQQEYQAAMDAQQGGEPG